jgi:uncharacterized UBP type Zn finger protein
MSRRLMVLTCFAADICNCEAKRIHLALSSCKSCDLKENLWLCLTCGNTGCGRQQFGGIGGNGHGMAHFDQTQHPVAVKLGTITPEGTAGIIQLLDHFIEGEPSIDYKKMCSATLVARNEWMTIWLHI